MCLSIDLYILVYIYKYLYCVDTSAFQSLGIDEFDDQHCYLPIIPVTTRKRIIVKCISKGHIDYC